MPVQKLRAWDGEQIDAENWTFGRPGEGELGDFAAYACGAVIGVWDATAEEEGLNLLFYGSNASFNDDASSILSAQTVNAWASAE